LSKTQNDQTAIRIEPADPQVIYPPVYDPSYVWEPPVSGAYSQQPSSYAWGSPSPRGYPQQQGYDSGRYPQQQGYDSGGYPQQQGYESRGYPQQQGYDSGGWNSGGGSGLNFGQAVNVAQTFSGLLGLGGWGGWGWAINWFTHNVLLNGSFFNLFGFHDSGGGFLQSAVWTHDPVHRGHVPYPYSFSPRAYNRGGFSAQVTAPHTRWYAPSPSSEWHRFQGSPSAQSYSRGAFSDYSHAGVAGRYNAPPQTNYGRDYRGSSNSALQARGSSYGGQASVGRAPGFSYSAPRAFQSQFSGRSSGSQHFSAPRVSAPRSSSHFSAPKGSSHFSFGHRSGSSGGHSGGRSRSHSGKSHKR
jgi:hypothetical protein